MTDYTELVKALVCDENCWDNKCKYLESSSYNWCNTNRLRSDAAAAIEALQANCEQLKTENKMLYNTITADKGVMLERIKFLEQQLPKRGKWVGVSPMVDTVQCSVCGGQLFSAELETPYCPYCGAKMTEVQK